MLGHCVYNLYPNEEKNNHEFTKIQSNTTNY